MVEETDSVASELAQQIEYGYFARWVRAADMFVNVTFGGVLDDTVSGRTARWRAATNSWFPCICCKLFNVIFQEKDHCEFALMADTARAELELELDAKDIEAAKTATEAETGAVSGMGMASPIEATTERKVIQMGMIHTEALALQVKLQSAASELMTQASKISTTVSQAVAEGRSSLNEEEAKLVASFDAKAELLGKVKDFLETL